MSSPVTRILRHKLWVAVSAAVIVLLIAAGIWFVRSSGTGDNKERGLYRAGARALNQRDYPRAIQRFEELQALNPSYGGLEAKLKQARLGDALTPSNLDYYRKKAARSSSPATTSPSSPGSSTRPGSQGGNSTSGQPTEIELLAMIPASVAGFEVANTELMDGTALRTFTPLTRGKIEGLAISAHGRATDALAQQFVETVDMRAFAHDAQTVVLGSLTAYFGTDGQVYATLAWSKGKVAFEVQMMSSRRLPKELMTDLVAVARQI